jgi:hypothetical protein
MKWFRGTLEIIGALSLLGLAVLGVLVIRDGSARVNTAGQKDALFILNWGGIATNQNYKIIKSYRSPTSFTGDHLDSYCIQLSRFDVADNAKSDWHDGPEQNPLLAEALELGINDASQHTDCFPSVQQANSGVMKMMFWSVVMHGRQPTAADILLYDPTNRRLCYVSYKT